MMALWVVYDSPKDFPDGIIARLWVTVQGEGTYPTDKTVTCLFNDAHVSRVSVLDAVRTAIKAATPGVVRVDRSPADEPHILEAWV